MKHFYLFTDEVVTVVLGSLTLRNNENKTVADSNHAIAAAPYADGYLVVATAANSVVPTHNGSHDGWMEVSKLPTTVLETEVATLIEAAVARAIEDCEQKQGATINSVLSIAHQSHIQRDKVTNYLLSELLKK